MAEEEKKLTKEEADEFIKKKAVGILVRADVTCLINELENFYGDSLTNGMIGETLPICNCPENYDDSDYEELEYVDYSDVYEEAYEAGDFNVKVYKWFVVDPRFAELLKEQGELIVLEANLWGCCEDIEDPSEASAVEDFFDRMQILYGQRNAIITEELGA